MRPKPGAVPEEEPEPNWTDDFDLTAPDEVETNEQLDEPLIHIRRPTRRELLLHLREEALADVITRLPEPGETFHIISASKFDYWLLVPRLLDLLQRPAAVYISTWTASRANVRDLIRLLDMGRIPTVGFLCGTYFIRREPAVAGYLQEELRKRSQRFRAFQNHTKVLLLDAPPDALTVEASANLTSNPRLENLTLTNDRDLLEFHRGWFEHFLTRR